MTRVRCAELSHFAAGAPVRTSVGTKQLSPASGVSLQNCRKKEGWRWSYGKERGLVVQRFGSRSLHPHPLQPQPQADWAGGALGTAGAWRRMRVAGAWVADA